MQVQHIVAVPDPTSLPEPDSMDPALPRLRKLLAGLDVDQDGVASRKDLLLAFRRDRQLADHLKMQPRVQVGLCLGSSQLVTLAQVAAEEGWTTLRAWESTHAVIWRLTSIMSFKMQLIYTACDHTLSDHWWCQANTVSVL